MNNNSKNVQLPIFREEDVLNVHWKSVKEKEGIDFLIGFVHWDYEQSYIPAKVKYSQHSPTSQRKHPIVPKNCSWTSNLMQL
jgi:hypothetical protein